MSKPPIFHTTQRRAAADSATSQPPRPHSARRSRQLHPGPHHRFIVGSAMQAWRESQESCHRACALSCSHAPMTSGSTKPARALTDRGSVSGGSRLMSSPTAALRPRTPGAYAAAGPAADRPPVRRALGDRTTPGPRSTAGSVSSAPPPQRRQRPLPSCAAQRPRWWRQAGWRGE
jgi:hypothetical protein